MAADCVGKEAVGKGNFVRGLTFVSREELDRMPQASLPQASLPQAAMSHGYSDIE
jgi:hypothetical protein